LVGLVDPPKSLSLPSHIGVVLLDQTPMSPFDRLARRPPLQSQLAIGLVAAWIGAWWCCIGEAISRFRALPMGGALVGAAFIRAGAAAGAVA